MSSGLLELQEVTEDVARTVCEALYWTPGSVLRMAGERDATFRVTDPTGTRFVLKLSAADSEFELDLQFRVLEHLETVGETAFPRLVKSRGHERLETVEVGARVLNVRLLTFLEGVPMAALFPRPEGLLRELGKLLASLDNILELWGEGAGERRLDWDIARVAEIPELTRHLPGDGRRQRVETLVDAYAEARARHASGLRRSLIHNDANDHNVIVTSRQLSTARLSGLIDFGDMVETETVHELAIAMCYAGLGEHHPWQAALPVLAGYAGARPLTADEAALLYPAVCARLAMSVSTSARRRAEGVADEYALVSERPAWAAIDALGSLGTTAANEAVARTLETAQS